MRKSLILAVSLSLFALSGFLFTPAVFAEDYTVKSVIIIPPDWQGKLDKTELETYKSGIINGLAAVRTLFANTLGGKTFQFDRNIDVVASKDPIEKVEEKLMLDRDYRSSFYTTVFPDRAGVVYIAWGIGTKNGFRRGDPVSKDFGFVWLKHQDILGLTADGTEDERKWSLVMVAHELGHAFGLVFAGYADGHPCTEESPQECSANAPRPYPGTYEWASVMGYGTPYLSFPNLFFNNTIYNPEIQKILKSPFVNPNNDPAPSPTASIAGQKLQGPVFFELIPATIIAGQNFAIKGVNLENFREFEIRRKDLSQAANKDRLQNAKMLDNNGSTIRINVAEDAVPSNSDSSWEIKLFDNKGASLTVPVELGIKGKDTAGAILAADITATCGPDKKAVQAAPVRLQTRNGSTLAQIDTQVDGTAILNYTIGDPSNRELALKADEIQGIIPTSDSPGAAGASSKDVTVPNPPQSFNASVSFHYPECPNVCNPKITFLCGGMGEAAGFPKGHTIKITPNCTSTNIYGEGLASKEDLGDRGECSAGVVVPNVTAGLPTPVERVSSRGTSGGTLTDSQGAPISQSTDTYTGLTADIAGEGTKIIISNYEDFRPDNIKDEITNQIDIGSPTVIVEPGSKVTWTLSTLDSADERQVSVAKIKDGKINDSTRTPYFVGDGDIIESGGVYIKTEKVKNFVIKNIVTVNGVRHELTASNPSISVRLNGTEGSPQAFNLPYEIYYAERARPEEDRLPINYQPPRKCECTFANSCTTANGEPGEQECSGVYVDEPGGRVCKYDGSGDCVIQCKTSCNPITRPPEPEVSPEPSEKPTPLPTPETNYCEEARYYPCEPGIATGSTCDLNGQTCTAYSKNQCNFKGQAYCDNSACGEPCEAPPATDCGTPESQYYQCIACNTRQEVYLDSCRNWTVGPDETSKDYCNDWCPPPPDQCTEVRQYNECTGCNTSRRISQDSCGNYNVIVDSQSDAACTDGCPPPPDQCTEVRQYNECTGCNTSRRISQDSCGNYNVIVDSQSDAACTDGCPPPAGIPPTPVINLNVGCIDGNNGSVFTISWSGTNISYADISKADSFNSFYNKGVSGSTSTDAPSGFSLYQVGTPLYIEPNTTYYFRIFDGTKHSGTASRTTPGACANYSPPPPTGCEPNKNIRNECIGCNLSQGICQRGDCSEYICIPSQSDGACANWCGGDNPCDNEDAWQYKCTPDVCPVDPDQGVGIPQHCENGQWVDKQSECTDLCP